MKTKLQSLLAISLLAAPDIALAGPGPAPVVKLESNLNFALTITGEGDEVVRGTRTSSRFTTSRMGPREVLSALEKLPRSAPADDEGSEGVFVEPFPPGSRLVANPDTGVWVVDRKGNKVTNVAMYVQVSVDREDNVVAYEFNSRTGNLREDNRTFVGLNIYLPDEMDTTEAPEDSGNTTEVAGNGTERFSLQNSRTKRTEIVTVNGSVSGTGYRPGLGQVVAGGTLTMRGREISEIDR